MGWEELARRAIEEIERALDRIDDPEDRRKFLTEIDEAVLNIQADGSDPSVGAGHEGLD